MEEESPQRPTGHSRWVTTRARLQNNPEALAEWEEMCRAERAASVDNDLDADNLPAWKVELAAHREELLANGGVYDESNGIVFVSPEARDKFYALLAEGETPEDREAKATINRIRARHDLSADTIAAVQEGVAEAERGETKDLGSFSRYLSDAELAETRDYYDTHDAVTGEELGDAFAEHAEESAEWARLAAVVNAETWTDNQEEPAAAKLDQAIADGTAGKTADPRCWLLWSVPRGQWWLPDAAGYTNDKNKAGRFTGPEVLTIYRHSAAGWDPSENNFMPSSVIVPDA